MCSLLSYNNIVIVLFAGDLHACGLYSYDSSSLFGFLWLANYTRVVCGFLHTVCMQFDTTNQIKYSKIVPKLFAIFKTSWMLAVARNNTASTTRLSAISRLY